MVIILIGVMIFSSSLVSADEKPKWEKLSTEENLASMERWSKKWPHISSKDAGFEIGLENRLRSAQLWVDIQKFKAMQKCECAESARTKNMEPPQFLKHNWTGLGGMGNTKDNSK